MTSLAILTSQIPSLSTAILGVDIGGVIMERGEDNSPDTSFFSENFLLTPEMPNAMENLKFLADGKFGSNIHLISAGGKRVQSKSRQWLLNKRFFENTGVSQSHITFCSNRLEKVEICRSLGITHMIDDSLEVIRALKGVIPHRYWFNPRAAEVDKMRFSHGDMVPYYDWSLMASAILTT